MPYKKSIITFTLQMHKLGLLEQKRPPEDARVVSNTAGSSSCLVTQNQALFLFNTKIAFFKGQKCSEVFGGLFLNLIFLLNMCYALR